MIAVTRDDIDFSLATQAFAGTSFTPERRAEAIIDGYVQHMEGVVARLTPLAETDEQKDALAKGLRLYRSGYISRLHSYLQSRTLFLSPMITGPANFPTHRNEKTSRTVDRRSEDLDTWAGRVEEMLRKKLVDMRTPGQKQDAEFRRLKSRINGCIGSLLEIEEGSPFNATSFKTNLANVMKRSADNGNIDAVRRATEYLSEAQTVLKRPAFTIRHRIWSYADQAEERLANEPKHSGTEVIAKYDGVEIVNNHDERRVQILFDGKPSDDVRSALRSEGWRWSRKHMAWQRQNTQNAVYSAKRIVENTVLDDAS